MGRLLYVQCGSEMVASLWMTEMSSPFLHMREILKELGYRDTDLNLVADVGVTNLDKLTTFSDTICMLPI